MMRSIVVLLVLGIIPSVSAFVSPCPKISSKQSLVRLSPLDFSDWTSSLLLSDDTVTAAADAVSGAADAVATAASAAAGTGATEAAPTSYSKLSYYTILALYAMSFPGVWSTIKRSTKAKIKRKTFVSPGENKEGGKGLRQQAGEIMAYMNANNYEVVKAGETITFRGVVQRSVGQASFLVFCTALGMASLALVLQIQFQNLTLPLIGEPNWYWLILLSPYAGIYYWKAGDRVDECQVKLESDDGDTENQIVVQGSEEELERMWRTLGWQEKGMVKVDGLLESSTM